MAIGFLVGGVIQQTPESHELGIELNALLKAGMIFVEYADYVPSICVPHPSVGAAGTVNLD